jgi:hypothetical protein
MPREGIERIVLGGKQLSKRVVPDWQIGAETFTQRIFLASPGGTYLAWADGKGALRVRDRKGRERVIKMVEGRDARFSADERYLATVRRDDGTAFEVVLLETRTGVQRVLAGIGNPGWMEWVKDGVVVSHQQGEKHLITYLPLDGEPSEVAAGSPSDLTTRFATARRGTRVMYFFQSRAYVVDVTGGDATEIGTLPGTVDNAEMAPDGSDAALTVSGTLHRWHDGGTLERLEVATGGVHTVWYSPDGAQLAYASLETATVLDGERRITIETSDYDIHAMRYRGDQLVLAMGQRAVLWNPKTGAKKVLGTTSKKQTLQAVDLYQGGLVMWTQEIRRLDRRRSARPANSSPFALAD